MHVNQLVSKNGISLKLSEKESILHDLDEF